MTPTPTNALAEHLAARRPEPNGDVPAHDPETGEITEPSTELVPIAPERPGPAAPDFRMTPPKVVGGLPYASTYSRLAHSIHGTELVPAAFRGRPAAVMAAMMRGYEMGFGPMQALDSFNVIEGKVGLTAEAMRGMIVGAGHLFVPEVTNDYAEIVCRRSDWPADMTRTVRYGLDDARKAGLLAPSRSGRPTAWQKFPRAMLTARATSEAGRRYFPDVLAGMSYTPEELADFEDGPTPTYTAPSPPAQPVAEGVAPGETTTAESPPVTPDPDPEPPQAAPKARRTRQAPPAAETPPEAPQAPQSVADVAFTHRVAVRGLNEVIGALPRAQQALVRAYLAQHGMGVLQDLDEAGMMQATLIAAGWPTSVHDGDGEIVTGIQESEPGVGTPGIVDAEVVVDADWSDEVAQSPMFNDGVTGQEPF